MKRVLFVFFLFCTLNVFAERAFYEGLISMHTKSGTAGLDRLYQIFMPLNFYQTTSSGKTYSFTLTPMYINRGEAAPAPTVGTYYNYINGTSYSNSIDTEGFYGNAQVSVFLNHVLLKYFSLGISPVGGEVDPVPTFYAYLSSGNFFSSLKSESVDDSDLSYTGMKDIYDDNRWGRVSRTGGQAGYYFELPNSYKFKVSAGIYYLWGRNVKENTEYALYSDFFKQITTGGGKLHVGLSFTSENYKHDLSGYYYGRGGYSSQQQDIEIGPYAMYRTDLGREYFLNLYFYPYYTYRKNYDSKKYYFGSGNAALSPAAQAEADSEIKGSITNRVYIDYQAQVKKLFGESWVGIMYAGVENSKVSGEIKCGVGVIKYFTPQKGVGNDKDYLNSDILEVLFNK